MDSRCEQSGAASHPYSQTHTLLALQMPWNEQRLGHDPITEPTSMPRATSGLNHRGPGPHARRPLSRVDRFAPSPCSRGESPGEAWSALAGALPSTQKPVGGGLSLVPPPSRELVALISRLQLLLLA
jgi:hypothetical protein